MVVYFTAPFQLRILYSPVHNVTAAYPVILGLPMGLLCDRRFRYTMDSDFMSALHAYMRVIPEETE
jgi:hypothetical protein